MLKKILATLIGVALVCIPIMLGGCGQISSATINSNTSIISSSSADTSNKTIITSTTVNTFGDGKNYTVSLFTTKKASKTSSTYQYVNLEIHGNGQDKTVPLVVDGSDCISPGLFVGDFTGDGKSDIFIKAPIFSGDGMAPTYCFVYSYAGGKLTRIFSNNDLDSYTYTVTHEDNYIVKIHSNIINQDLYGDLSSYYKANPPGYSDSHMNGFPMYNASGKVSPNIPHWDMAIVFDVSAFNNVNGFDREMPNAATTYNTFGLSVFQSVFGTNMHDDVGGVLSYLSWNKAKGKFVVVKQIYDSLN